MERSENFYITLDSQRIKFKSEQDNNADFKVSIPNGITLSNDKKWEVGLVDGIIPNKVFNITDSNNTFFLVIRNPRYPQRLISGYKSISIYNDYFFYDSQRNRKMNYNYRYAMFYHYKIIKDVNHEFLSDFFPDDHLDDEKFAIKYGVKRSFMGPKDNNISNKYYDNICTLLPFKIPIGVYNDYKILTSIMEDSWNKMFSTLWASTKYNLWKASSSAWDIGVSLSWEYNHNPYYMYYKKKSLSLVSNIPENLGILVPTLLGNMLGIDSSQEVISVRNKPHYFAFPKMDCFVHEPYLYLGLTNLYVYTNIIDFSIVGSGQSQLLRQFTYNQAPNVTTHKSIQFKHIHYLPITDKRINDIYIFIRNELGEPIHLTGDICIVRLEFRRRPL